MSLKTDEHPALEPDNPTSVELSDFASRLIDAFGKLEARVIALEAQHIERLTEIRTLSVAALATQGELEALRDLNVLTFSKISEELAALGVDRATITAALPPTGSGAN